MSDALERAVALQYTEESERPQVLAAGVGTLARLIRHFAETNGIPVQKDADVFEILDACRAEQPLSERAVAVLSEVIRFLVSVENSKQA